jgi:DNA invertase Pin-like site-specific DNA recombinase
MRTIIYARFSTDLQNPKSCEDQIAELTERCQREGWKIVGTYADEDTRGAAGIDETARPGIHRLLQHVKQGGIDQVLAETTSRIARHRGDLHKVHEWITFVGARLFTTAQGEITEVTATIHGLMDAEFSRTTGHHVRRGQAGSVKDGRSPCGVAYGYATDNKIAENGRPQRGRRIIEAVEAAIVTRIFTEYAQNLSPRKIAERLNTEEFRAPEVGSGRPVRSRATENVRMAC